MARCYSSMIPVRVRPELAAALHHAVKITQHRSRSHFIRQALRQYLEGFGFTFNGDTWSASDLYSQPLAGTLGYVAQPKPAGKPKRKVTP